VINVDEVETIESHTVPVSFTRYQDINDKLTLEEIDKFFKGILNMHAEEYRSKSSFDDDDSLKGK